jgi:Ca-activated chloride channel family protein
LPEGGFLKDQQGNIVVPKLNSSELAKLAQAGNGIYQTITANDADIQTVLANADRSVEQQGKQNDNLLLDQWADKGPWLLLLVLPLAALTFRKGLLCFALLLILPLPKNSYALGWQDLWQTKDQQAQQAYKKQDYAKAAEQFENPDWKAAAQYKADQKEVEEMKTPKTATGFYNQGNVLANSGRYEEAIAAYDKALNMSPEKQLAEDAKHNKEVVEKALEKQQQQNQQQDDKQQSKDDSQQNKDDKQSEKSGEQKSDQNNGEEKPEQKPEQKQSDQQQSDENQQQDKAEEKKPDEAEKPQQSEQNKDEAKDQAKEQAPVKEEPTDEQQQANEQWLKRIPDDPSGLLKRKFKYQYGQRGRQSAGDTNGW